MSACVSACMRACLRACVRMCVLVCVSVCACVTVLVFSLPVNTSIDLCVLHVVDQDPSSEEIVEPEP